MKLSEKKWNVILLPERDSPCSRLYVLSFSSFISELNVKDCATNTQLCNRNAVCKTMEGSSICICNHGYAGNGKICTGNHYNITNIPIRVVLSNQCAIQLTYILLCVGQTVFPSVWPHPPVCIFVYRLIYFGLVYFLMGVFILMIF